MSKTYAIKTEDGATHYVSASRPSIARKIWERAHNEKIVSITLCKQS